jgi:hypothetical protein
MPDWFTGSEKGDKELSDTSAEIARKAAELNASKMAALATQFRRADQIITFVSLPENMRRGKVEFKWPEDATYIMVRTKDGDLSFVTRHTVAVEGLADIESYAFITVLDDPDEALRVEEAYQALVKSLAIVAPGINVNPIAFRVAHESKRNGDTWSETAVKIRDEVGRVMKEDLDRKLSEITAD